MNVIAVHHHVTPWLHVPTVEVLSNVHAMLDMLEMASIATVSSCMHIHATTDGCFWFIFRVDNNECLNEQSPCVAHATCIDTVGSFTCTCDSGYEGDGLVSGSGCSSKSYLLCASLELHVLMYRCE